MAAVDRVTLHQAILLVCDIIYEYLPGIFQAMFGAER